MGRTSHSGATGNLFDEDMIALLIASILTLGRSWMDVFILAVNCRDWMKKKCLNVTDRILTLQGSIRIYCGCSATLWYILVKFYPWIIETGYIFRVLMFNFRYFTVWYFWLTASLCSYYCVKIADFSHPIFVHLKRRLPGLVSAWLLGTAILPLAASLPYTYSDMEIWGNKKFSNLSQNNNVTAFSQIKRVLHVRALQGVVCFTAFSICAISALLLLFSLWRHHQRMLGSWDGRRSPQTNAHYQAVIIILALLINNVIAFVCILLSLSNESEGTANAKLAAMTGLYGSFSVETLISLWGNKKLRNELRRALSFAKCRGRAS